MRKTMKTVSLLLFFFYIINALDIKKRKIDSESNADEEPRSFEQYPTNSMTIKAILNDGKPFYVARDPETGTLDFNIKKTVGIQSFVLLDPKGELSQSNQSSNDINSLGHKNFHDYLNLPVKYSSSKFVYPFISGSYANLKYQGNNKDLTSNHKNYINLDTLKFNLTHHVNNISETRLINNTRSPEEILSTKKQTVPSTNAGGVDIILTTQTTASSLKVEPTTYLAPSSLKYSSTIVQNSFPSTFENKYSDSPDSKKRTTMATTSTKSLESSTALPADGINFLDNLLLRLENKEKKLTTNKPQTEDNLKAFLTSKPSAFKVIPVEKQKTSQKMSFESGSQNPSVMTLPEIINSLSAKGKLNNEQVAYLRENNNLSQIKNEDLNISLDKNNHRTLQKLFLNDPIFEDTKIKETFFPEEYQDYVKFDGPGDQYDSHYVRFKVQEPNIDLVEFQQIPSMNNIVISPGQNSASFVLGSQQSVGTVENKLSVGKIPFADAYQSMKESNDDALLKQSQISNQVQSSIRFPSDPKQQPGSAQIGEVPDDIEHEGSTREILQLEASSKDNMSNKPLVFPNNEQNSSSYKSAIVFKNPSQIISEDVNEIYGKIIEKQKHDVKNSSNNIRADDLTPSRVLTPPNQLQYFLFNKHYLQPSKNTERNLMSPKRIPGLPNILPQFRPNTKSSSIFPTIKDQGVIRIPMKAREPLSNHRAGYPHMFNSNSFISKRPQTIHYDGAKQSQINQNRREFKIPVNGTFNGLEMNQSQFNDRVYPSSPVFKAKLHQKNDGVPETMQMKQRISNILQLHDGELNKLSPPPTFQKYVRHKLKNEQESNNTRLEAVNTLQMLQSNKKNMNKLNFYAPDTPKIIKDQIENKHYDQSKRSSIYVVYPISTKNISSISSSNSIEMLGISENKNILYQQTPFSVVSHFEQEPLLTKKDKKKNLFPYPLERHVPHDHEAERTKPEIKVHDNTLYNLGEKPIKSRVDDKKQTFMDFPVLKKLSSASENPIAIAYTPTEPNIPFPSVENFYLHHHFDKVVPEIREEKANYSHYQHHQQKDEHSNKENYHFQAPFQASMSLTQDFTNPYEGWQSTENTEINRTDLNYIDLSQEITTRKFNPNEFQPVYESGFQPILDKRTSTPPNLVLFHRENFTNLSQDSSTQSVVEFTETSSEKQISEKVDNKEIDSLEAFFESLTSDYDEDVSENKS